MNGKHELAASRSGRSSILPLACALIAVTAFSFAIERGEQTMFENAAAAVSRAPKPLVDTVVPKQIATATFAMG